MDEKLITEIAYAQRQLKLAELRADNADEVIDCLQRAQDAMDRARAIAHPPAKPLKKRKEDPVPPGVEATLLP